MHAYFQYEQLEEHAPEVHVTTCHVDNENNPTPIVRQRSLSITCTDQIAIVT